VHRQVEAKEKDFEKLKRRLEQQQNEEVFIEDECFLKICGKEDTKNEMDSIKEASDFEQMKQR